MLPYSDSIAYDTQPGGPLAVVPDTATPLPQSLLAWLIDNQVVLAEEWEELSGRDRALISELSSNEELLNALVQRHLLTRFQADAVRKGNGAEIVLAQYRLLDILGQGGMGTVYRAEHFQLRREVAVKVMARAAEGNERMVSRFYAEARAVARLQHPNIVDLLRRRPRSEARPQPTAQLLLRHGVDRRPGPLPPGSRERTAPGPPGLRACFAKLPKHWPKRTDMV